MTHPGMPRKQGLYDPRFEHDACGIGFVVNIKGNRSHHVLEQALTVLLNLDHRGARGCEEGTGDGAGILLQVPHDFLQHSCEELGFELPKPLIRNSIYYLLRFPEKIQLNYHRSFQMVSVGKILKLLLLTLIFCS